MNINKFKRKINYMKKINNMISKSLYYLLTPLRFLYSKNKIRKRNIFDKKVNNLTDNQAVQILGDNIIKYLIKSKSGSEEVVVCEYSKDGWYSKNIYQIIDSYSTYKDVLRLWKYKKLRFNDLERFEELTDILKDYINTIDGVSADYYIDDKRGNGGYYSKYKKTLKITLEEK
jgi:hypothetical protein